MIGNLFLNAPFGINFNYYRFDFRGVFRPTDYTDGHRCSVLSCVFLTQIFRIARIIVVASDDD